MALSTVDVELSTSSNESLDVVEYRLSFLKLSRVGIFKN